MFNPWQLSGATEKHTSYHQETASLSPDENTAICGHEPREQNKQKWCIPLPLSIIAHGCGRGKIALSSECHTA